MSRATAISQLRSRYIRYRLLETILFSLGIFIAVGGLTMILTSSMVIALGMAVVASIGFFIWRYNFLELSAIDDLRIAFHLNRMFPQLQESTDLLAQPEDGLTVMQQLQLERINSRLTEALPEVKFPHHLLQASLVFILSIVFFFALRTIQQGPINDTTSSVSSSDNKLTTADSIINASLSSFQLAITPPSYTKLPQVTSKQLSISVAEGSELLWRLSFKGVAKDVNIIFSDGKRIKFTETKGTFSASFSAVESALYQLQWESNEKITQTDYYKIDVKEDQVPQLAITNLPQFTRLMWGEKSNVLVTSTIRDDYGIDRAHIIATVSKGSGESVKFREEKLPFDAPTVVKGRDITANRTIDFAKLGMEPGDEVYFYVEAFDNKRPTSQRNRTETFFISLQDTTAQDVGVDPGLGVDLMPDYFRSQRQLIIDTEKLIREKPTLAKQVFNSTSNELGYDQKVLRLRYGQFMGEEFETAIGQPTEVDKDNAKDDDFMKQYGHQHDTQNEHNLVAEKKPKVPEHQHKEGEEEDPMAALRHDHDKADEATFFTQSIKTKLRAALSLMWDSELHLRLYHPQESLPYQYQILKLLKEIAQDSRVYVHRMGFDPPPLKEDRRLTADLDEIDPASANDESRITLSYPAIRKSLNEISAILQSDSIVLSEKFIVNLKLAGNELAALALAQPGDFLARLSQIRSITENEAEKSAIPGILKQIQSTFWKVIPKDESSPIRRGTTAHPLDILLLKELKRQGNE